MPQLKLLLGIHVERSPFKIQKGFLPKHTRDGV